MRSTVSRLCIHPALKHRVHLSCKGATMWYWAIYLSQVEIRCGLACLCNKSLLSACPRIMLSPQIGVLESVSISILATFSFSNKWPASCDYCIFAPPTSASLFISPLFLYNVISVQSFIKLRSKSGEFPCCDSSNTKSDSSEICNRTSTKQGGGSHCC